MTHSNPTNAQQEWNDRTALQEVDRLLEEVDSIHVNSPIHRLIKDVLGKAELTAPVSGVPDGWKLVPVEPTHEMQNHGSVCRYNREGTCTEIYKAMISAAPQQPASQLVVQGDHPILQVLDEELRRQTADVSEDEWNKALKQLDRVMDTELDEYFGYYVWVQENEHLIRAALTRAKSDEVVPVEAWQPLTEWHEDYGECLFLFHKNSDYCGVEWTSPITYEADGTSFQDKYGDCDDIQFKRVDTSNFTLLAHAAGEAK